jgi:Nuclease-related domain
LIGALGEKHTARVLEPLRTEGWTLVHDLSDGKRNLDHIAVGPGGVFVLDSKHLGGEATVREDGVLEVRRPDFQMTCTSNPASRHR